jgi:hypothetical protein
LNAITDFFGGCAAASAETKETSKPASVIKLCITGDLVGIIKWAKPTVNPNRDAGTLVSRDVFNEHIFFNELLLVPLSSRQQCLNWDVKPFRGGFKFFEHLDL